MIKFIFTCLSRYFFLKAISINLTKKEKDDFKDLNFRQNDFNNYKVIKHHIIKEDFIYNLSIPEIHNFNFLLFYQKLGGKTGIDLSKKNIFLWFKKFKNYKSLPWSEDLPSKRFINIIYSYDFICSLSNQKEVREINFILNFHIKRIFFEFYRKKIEDLSSFELVAITLINCIKNNFNEKFVQTLRDFLNSHVDESGMHKSYNLIEHAKFINNLNEIKSILLFFQLKIPESLNNSILAMTSLISTYKHDDQTLPLFNGCNNNHNNVIQNILSKEQFLKSKNLTVLKNGIVGYKDKNKALFLDVVQPTNFPYHNDLSAGSLAFEMSADGEKIITNCGGTEINGKNPEYLKYSAAHSTIIINNTNISEIKEKNKNNIFPKQVVYETKSEGEKIYLIGSHNGYSKNYKKICKRKLIVNKKNYTIRGEDSIISLRSSIEKHVFHIRFHLMPELTTTLTENKKNIIIKTNNNNVWVFRSNSEVMINNSIYVKNDIAIETSQIVISGVTSSLKNKIIWSLEKT